VSPEHRRPLLAFVLVTLLCTLVVGNSLSLGSNPNRSSIVAELRAEISAAVDEANKAVSRAEQIREFRILPVDFTEAGGEMTPTLKVKRQVVAKTFADDIAAIYAGTTTPS